MVRLKKVLEKNILPKIKLQYPKQMKACLLIGAYLNRLDISQEQRQDLNFILAKIDNLANLAFNIAF